MLLAVSVVFHELMNLSLVKVKLDVYGTAQLGLGPLMVVVTPIISFTAFI